MALFYNLVQATKSREQEDMLKDDRFKTYSFFSSQYHSSSFYMQHVLQHIIFKIFKYPFLIFLLFGIILKDKASMTECDWMEKLIMFKTVQ